MIPINSTLKIVGAGDARRHLETGFRLTHIPPHAPFFRRQTQQPLRPPRAR